MRVISCCGGKRSGSTLQFNLVRTLVELSDQSISNLRYLSGNQIEDSIAEYLTQNASNSEFLTYKTHDIESVPADHLMLYILRDPRDAYLSAKYKWGSGPKEIDAIVTKCVAGINIAQERNALIQRYESVFGNERTAAKEISDFLDLNLTETEIANIAEEVGVKARQKSLMNQIMIHTRDKLRSISQLSPLTKTLLKPLAATYRWVEKIRLSASESQIHADHISRHGGKPGVWQTELTDEERAIFVNVYSKELTELGYHSK